MHTFTYPLFFRLLYKFGNIPVTVILAVYLVPLVINVDRNLLYLIPVIIILLLIYYVNRYYLNLYKIIPYKIISDEEKIYCTEFLFSKKEVRILFADIIHLKGGVFDGRLKGLMRVYDGRNKIHIGFYPKLKNTRELEKILLNHINQAVYDEVLERVKLNQK